jgi:hypothetical protein
MSKNGSYYITAEIDGITHYFTEHSTWTRNYPERVLLDFQTALRQHERLRNINPYRVENVTTHPQQ